MPWDKISSCPDNLGLVFNVCKGRSMKQGRKAPSIEYNCKIMEMLGLQGLLGLQVEQDRTPWRSGLVKNLANRTARKCLNVMYLKVLP